MSSPSTWTAWQPAPDIPLLAPHVLAETLDGGQAFRWQQQPDGIWLGQWDRHVMRLTLDDHDRLLYSTHSAGQSGGLEALLHYLGAPVDPRDLTDLLPWRTDPHLARAVKAFPQLRIVRQPFGETLLGFLCSATKQIVQIKQMVALLAERHGEKLPGGFYQLPTWAKLAILPEEELRACLLGFRARYIKETALYLAARPGWLEETPALPYETAKARLLELPGVGEKVADCVLLFGAGKLEAFPVDTWILKSMAARYGLTAWKPAQVAHFGRVHFGPLAGLAQQYLFAWERRHGQTALS